jgi:hypothetical protein
MRSSLASALARGPLLPEIFISYRQTNTASFKRMLTALIRKLKADRSPLTASPTLCFQRRLSEQSVVSMHSAAGA